jgi:ubiquinone/menaquinone biosynthesis C-methylase UbiE
MRSERQQVQSRLADGWDANAGAWIEWTRRELDSYSTHKLAFLPLIPPPGRLTVDVGAGEGRVSRELQAQGHRVLAIDRSLTMSQSAATHPEEPVPAVVADAVNLPVPDAAADCAVAFMSLHDIDNVVPAIAEIGRILAVGGKLVMAIVHPLNSAGYFDRDAAGPKPPYIIRDAYTEARHYTNTRTRDGLSMTYHGIHRPLHAYTEALADAGLVIERLREQTTDDPDNKWYRIPLFLHIVASRPCVR